MGLWTFRHADVMAIRLEQAKTSRHPVVPFFCMSFCMNLYYGMIGRQQ